MNDIMINSSSLINITNPKFIPKLKMPKADKSTKPNKLLISDSLNLANDRCECSINKKIQYNNANYTINFNPLQNRAENKKNTSFDMIYKQ